MIPHPAVFFKTFRLTVIRQPPPVFLVVRPLVLLEGLEALGDPVGNGQPVALILAVIGEPLGPGLLLLSISVNLLLAPGVPGGGIGPKAGELLDFSELLDRKSVV